MELKKKNVQKKYVLFPSLMFSENPLKIIKKYYGFEHQILHERRKPIEIVKFKLSPTWKHVQFHASNQIPREY